jgi:hypothetical protein
VWDSTGVFLLNAILLLVWLAMAASMRPPRYLASEMIRVGAQSEQSARVLEQELLRLSGVVEVSVCTEDGVAYMKVDKQQFDMDALERYMVKAEAGSV